MTMETSRTLLLLTVSLHIFPSYLKPIEKWDGELGIHKGHQETKDGVTDHELKEILNKEYETVHGRILAVNLAHVRKRSVLENDTELENNTATENAFQEIEKANRDLLTKLYQGDIDLEGDTELKEYITTGGNSRNAIRERKRLWTSRVIPYRIPPGMQHAASNIQTAINEFHRKTCVRFVPYNRHYHKNYIEFTAGKGCWSKVGKKYYQTGRQKISLGDGCTFVGTIIHEMMHSLGFFHEQSRSDRDRYVKIYWENILDGLSSQFDKYTWKSIDDLGVSYDYQSIMHYDRKAFTKNGKPTIVAIGNENMEFKNPDFRLSTRDAVEINALYNCQIKTYGWTSWSGWTPCDKNCYRTRERFCYHSGNVKSCGGNANTYGVEKQSVKCPRSICPVPVDGGWSRWSDWSDCSKTCNDGVKTRFRKCDRPEPLHGGKPCPGIVEIEAPCILKRCTLDPDDVDFENIRLGMWENSKIDDFDWRFNKEYTLTVDTGPDADHTTGKGYYLYAESTERPAGQRAQLISSWQAAQPDGMCLKFYYTMYGKTMGSLSIKLEMSNSKNWLIFYETGNQGKGWKKGMGNIDVPLGLFYRLTIEARIGQTGYSDIAIDDVYIDPGLCDCQDDLFTCHIWASKGECKTNPTWMERNCKRSCKVCPKALPTPPPTTPPPTIGASSLCRDGESQCPGWASNGECKKNAVWMSENCRRSCNMCNAVGCTDSSIHCPTWAKSGECAKNPDWMNRNCKLSCGQCT